MSVRTWLPVFDPVDPNQRWRKYGLISSLLGCITLTALIIGLHLNNRASIVLFVTAIPCCITLIVTAVSCWTNYRVKPVLFVNLILLFMMIWTAGLIESAVVGMQIHGFALFFFLPLLVVSMLNHKIIFALMPVQFALVFVATKIYSKTYFSAEFQTIDTVDYVAYISATCSALSFLMTGLISMIRDNSDRKFRAALEEKRQLANTDPLTGLANRRAFFETLKELWDEQRPFVLAYLDLLRFKPLNDQYGHAAGDAVLKELSARMQNTPHMQLVARLGGDEFAIILDPDFAGDPIIDVISDIHAQLTNDVNSKFGVLNVGVSIGCAKAFTDVSSLTMLTSAAETAMRRAKSRGLPWAEYKKDIDEASLTTSAIEVAFKHALNAGKIRAAVQPLVCAATKKIVGYELLSRWVDSGFEKNPTPDQFVPIAEKLGLLNELLWRTLDETLSNLDLSGLKLSINVSPGQIASTDFLVRLMATLSQKDVSPCAIVLEVTEQVAFRNIERNVEVLRKARALGMSIALDDFGTGYASLSIIDSLPLDKVKIDRSFVQPSDRGSRKDAILSAAIQMCQQLDLVCCVEGVETKAVADAVAALGADEVQGYLFGRPCLVKDLSRLTLVA